jgi:hypothetical protein
MARGRYNEQEPDLYGDQFGDFYYDPNTGEFVSAPVVSGIGAPAVAYVAPQPEPAPAPFVPQYREPDPEPVYYAPQAVAQPSTPAASTMFLEDDYTGRMGPDGEPERYSTMRGGDPRLAQQREIEVQQQRLQGPIKINSWMTSGTKDVRGTEPAESITLQPGRQYQIVDFTGKNNGEIIASGSTPEEFLRMQDTAERLNAQGRRADWRLQEVSDEPSDSKFGSALEPETGKYITTLGGDLYNKSGWSTVADIAKIAVPIALQFVPGLGTALGAKLGLSGLGAKAAGVGLTSAIGRTGAGVVTGENIGDALKAGAISGLGSAATAGLLGATGVDKALGSAFSGAKGAIVGEGAGQTASQVAGQALQRAAEEGLIEVVASRLAPTILSGLGAAGGSLLGDVGKSLAQPSQFQQALDQARLENQYTSAPVEDEIIALGQRITPTIPGTDAVAAATGSALTAPLSPSDLPAQAEQPAQPPGEEEIVVSGTALPKVDLIGGLGGAAAAGGFDQFLSDNAGMVGDGTAQQPAEAPADEEIVVSNTATPRVDLSGLGGLVPALIPAPPAAAPSLLETAVAQQPAEAPADEEIIVTSQPTPRVDLSGLGGIVPALIPTPPAAPAVEILPGETLLEAVAKRLPETRLDAGLSAAAGSLFPAASADVSLPGEELIDVAARRLPETRLDSGLSAAAGALAPAAPSVEEIVVTSTPTRPDEIRSGISALTPEVISNIVSATESLGYAPSTVEEEALAEGRRYEKPSIASALAVPVSQTYPIAEGATDVLPDDETLVEGRRIQPPPIDAALVGLPVAAAVAAPAVLSGGAAPQGPLGTSTPSTVETGAAGAGGLTAKQVINGITAANAVGALISDALAGGGGGGGPLDVGTGYTVPTGRARQLAAATFDPFTYGQREGEFAFFGDGMAEGGEVDDDMVSHLIAYRKGGGHMGPGQVKGIGSGQEDKIPAWLSDGEYVWSAQDVADLGDGSTDEGVRRLDKMRQMVRRGAGRKDVKKIAKPQRGIEDMLKAVGGAV